jgi:hypothetical protein
MGEVIKIVTQTSDSPNGIKKEASPNTVSAAKKSKSSSHLSPDSKSKKKKAMTQEGNNTQVGATQETP